MYYMNVSGRREIWEGITKHLENEPPSEVDTAYGLFAMENVRV
jgi:hypothetical protein